MTAGRSTKDWWASRRRGYNIGLVVAGIVAFLPYYAIISAFQKSYPAKEIEVTIFSIAFQGVLYLTAMALANVFYNLGPAIEPHVSAKNRDLYRSVALSAGCFFSFALPFAIPAYLLYLYLFDQAAFVEGIPDFYE